MGDQRRSELSGNSGLGTGSGSKERISSFASI
jgi:hypothetical protein